MSDCYILPTVRRPAIKLHTDVVSSLFFLLEVTLKWTLSSLYFQVIKWFHKREYVFNLVRIGLKLRLLWWKQPLRYDLREGVFILFYLRRPLSRMVNIIVVRSAWEFYEIVIYIVLLCFKNSYSSEPSSTRIPMTN